MAAILGFLFFLALLWLWLLLSPAHRATYRDRLDSTSPTKQPVERLPPVVVIVAARNEASMLPQTIPTICRQEYPDLRVVLVDDQSDDDSASVIDRLVREHPNLTAIRAAARPDGWIGKCWAVHQGVEFSRSEPRPGVDSSLLLFTDADILFHPRAVRNAVERLLDLRLDMLSLMPRCICESPIERLCVGGLMTLLAIMFPTGWANDLKKKGSALACGAFMLIRPEPYDQVGGHASVRSCMIEDINLARHLKRSGALVAVYNTRDLVRTRMYDGFKDLWEGLTKNAYAGMEYQPRKFWVGLIAGMLVGVLPPVYLLLSTLWAINSRTPAAMAACGLAFIINLLMVLVHARTTRHLGFPIQYALALPLSLLLYNVIAVNSAFQHHFRGGNAWKGRRYERGMLLGAGKV